MEIKIKTRVIIVFGILLFVMFGCGQEKPVIELKESNESTEDEIGEEQETKQPESKAELKADTVFVYVCGAVQRPGVYELKQGSRVFQAIEMAEGFTEEASLASVNQAQIIEDGQQIVIPTAEEVQSYATMPDGQIEKEDTRVNINIADSTGLMTLPGIGESKALDIISYREQNGAFQAIEEIKNVSGIGEKTYDKIKEAITVD